MSIEWALQPKLDRDKLNDLDTWRAKDFELRTRPIIASYFGGAIFPPL